MDEEINPINRNTSIDFQGCVPLGLAENYNFFDPNPSNHSDYSKTNHVIPIDHSLSIDENTIPIQYNENYNFSINSMFDQVQTNINHYYAMVPLDSSFPYHSVYCHLDTNIYGTCLSIPNQTLNPNSNILYPFGLNNTPYDNTSLSIHNYPIYPSRMNTLFRSNSIHPYTLNPLGSNYSYVFNENSQQIPTPITTTIQNHVISPFYTPNNTLAVLEASGCNFMPASFYNPHPHDTMNLSFQNPANTDYVFENNPHRSNYNYSFEIRLGLYHPQEIINANAPKLRRTTTRELSDQCTYRCGLCGSEYSTYQVMDGESSNQNSRISNAMSVIPNQEPTKDEHELVFEDT